MAKVVELQMDGLPGPSHHFGGLAMGNLASHSHAGKVSNPLTALKQTLAKTAIVYQNGLPQAVLPPHERPDLNFLRRMGFRGSDGDVLKKAYASSPAIFYSAWSSSAMWTANAATISPFPDTGDQNSHVTPANLVSHLHRSLETDFTAKVLKKIFSGTKSVIFHPALPSNDALADEGAANHMRMCESHGRKGLEIFVYGREMSEENNRTLFRPRQTLEAGQTIARNHGLLPDRVLFLRQSQKAIDAGVFHNDVAAVSNESVLLVHAQAFAEGEKAFGKIEKACGKLGFRPIILSIPDYRVSLEQAVETYMFNSQLLSLSSGGMVLLCPEQCKQNRDVKSVLDEIVSANNPINQVDYLSLEESMGNGGGPACLRLRIVLQEEDHQALPEGILLNEKRAGQLLSWADNHYRDHLDLKELLDPEFVLECRKALDDLTEILGLGSIYSFQR